MLTAARPRYLCGSGICPLPGHDDMRAALIYQRATSQADRLIADRLSGLVNEHRRTRPDGPEDDEEGGPAGALVPVS